MPFCFLATSAGKVTEDALLGSQETPDWQQTNDGLTVMPGASIHDAAKSGSLDAVKGINATNSAAVNEKDSYGETALHIVAKQGNNAMVEPLVPKGSNVSFTNKSGLTPAKATKG